MKLLLDTHLLLWTAGEPDRRSALAEMLIEDLDNEMFFSVASVWELAIKAGSRRAGVELNPSPLRSQLLRNGYREIAVTAQHALATRDLPWIHRDPFDRMLLAQAIVEDLVLLTADAQLARYPGPVRHV